MHSVSCGSHHTVCVNIDGKVFSFGGNEKGQLGLGIGDSKVGIPQNVPFNIGIKNISCGFEFTICLDQIGKLWSFGSNEFGQLGIGNKEKYYKEPQLINDISNVASISCGGEHTLCLTLQSELWSFGRNHYGQLVLENKLQNAYFPQRTKQQNITLISAGFWFSVFQSLQGIVYVVGNNGHGQLGTGNKKRYDKPIGVPGLPKIKSFSAGGNHVMYLDVEGRLYGVGYNEYGQLGIGTNQSRSTVQLIEDIPKIKEVSCGYRHTMCIDEENNIWTFGHNGGGRLGIGNLINQNKPIQIPIDYKIQKISFGLGHQSIIMDINNNIYSFGRNKYGALGIGLFTDQCIPVQLNLESFEIKSAKWKNFQKLLNLPDGEIDKLSKIYDRINIVKFSFNENNIYKLAHPNSFFDSWDDILLFLSEKLNQSKEILQDNNHVHKIFEIKEQIEKLEHEFEVLQKRMIEITEIELPEAKKKLEAPESENLFQNDIVTLQEMKDNVKKFTETEKQLNQELLHAFQEKTLEKFNENQIPIVLWKMNLSKYHDCFIINNINGSDFCMLDDLNLIDFGFNYRDICMFFYYRDLMQCNSYFDSIKSPDKYKNDCIVCFHDTPEKTLWLLNEYDISIDNDLIINQGWSIPFMIYMKTFNSFNIVTFSKEGRELQSKISLWKSFHQEHLDLLK